MGVTVLLSIVMSKKLGRVKSRNAGFEKKETQNGVEKGENKNYSKIILSPA